MFDAAPAIDNQIQDFETSELSVSNYRFLEENRPELERSLKAVGKMDHGLASSILKQEKEINEEIGLINRMSMAEIRENKDSLLALHKKMLRKSTSLLDNLEQVDNLYRAVSLQRKIDNLNYNIDNLIDYINEDEWERNQLSPFGPDGYIDCEVTCCGGGCGCETGDDRNIIPEKL